MTKGIFSLKLKVLTLSFGHPSPEKEREQRANAIVSNENRECLFFLFPSPFLERGGPLFAGRGEDFSICYTIGHYPITRIPLF
jgi:hypothetical protein